jgi:hypothetical protein
VRLIEVHLAPKLRKAGFINQQKSQESGKPGCNFLPEGAGLPRYGNNGHLPLQAPLSLES